ncbi:MAG: hypothetical protein D8B51_08270, partial [Tannerella sp.]
MHGPVAARVSGRRTGRHGLLRAIASVSANPRLVETRRRHGEAHRPGASDPGRGRPGGNARRRTPCGSRRTRATPRGSRAAERPRPHRSSTRTVGGARR